MSSIPYLGLSRNQLEALSLVEPTATLALNDDRLIHVDGQVVADAEQRACCQVAGKFAAAAASVLLHYRAYLAENFALSGSCVLFQAHHARELRRLLAHSSTDEANRFIEAQLSVMDAKLRAEIALPGAQLLPSSAELVAGGQVCEREHRDLLRVLFVVTCAYARAWDESWARDVLGPAFS